MQREVIIAGSVLSYGRYVRLLQSFQANHKEDQIITNKLVKVYDMKGKELQRKLKRS